MGSCHDKKSEQAGCIASTEQDSTFQLIVGFKQYHQSSTRNSRQRRSFADNVLINLWQSQMVDKNETSNLRQCQSFVNKMIVVLFQISARAWPSKTMYCKEAQLVVEWSFHNEPSRLINGLVGHSKLTELNGLVIHHELIELINEFVHHSELNVGHIKFFRLCRMIVGSSSEGAKIVTIFPSSEGA